LGYKNAWSAYNYYFWIPLFIPFFACFLGALTYDIFIYTGDSPINNGDWSLINFRKGVNKMFRREKIRDHRSDEENLGVKQDQETIASDAITEHGECKPSRPSLQGIDSERTCQERYSDAHEANCEMEFDPNANITNARKGGYHGEAWEDTEEGEKAGRKPSEQSLGCHRNDHDEQAREAGQPANDAEQRRKDADRELQGKKGKGTGYDDHCDAAETCNDGSEEVDKHGNEA
jgi:hypothetical protein